MDINAITGALTKALARYSEIQNTDRYESLPASVREEKIASIVSQDIRTLLAAQPEFGADRIVHTALVVATFSRALVRKGLSRGTTAAVEWLQKILSTKQVRGFEVQALYGIRVESDTSLLHDIKLVPFDAVPDSRPKQGLLERPSLSPYHPPPFHAFTPPGAALLVPVEVKPFFVKPSTGETQQPNSTVDWKSMFVDIRHCLAISHREPIVPGPSWFQYEDPDFEAVAIVKGVASFSHQEVLRC